MDNDIEKLKEELKELRAIAARRVLYKKKRANELIPAYENSIKILEKVNENSTSEDKALILDIVIKCPYCHSKDLVKSMSIQHDWFCNGCSTFL